MTHVNYVQLSAVVKLNPLLKDKAALATETVDFLPMAAVKVGASIAVATETRQLGDVKQGFTSFVDGDVLVAKITPCFENGKIAQVRIGNRYGFGSTEFHVLRPDLNRLDGRFLVHFLRGDKIRLAGERKMTGSAGQRRVPKHFFESLLIHLPALAEQRRIAAILDQADALRVKRRETLAQLDSLTQAIFVEMFGDPAINPKGWHIKKIGNLLESASYGTIEKASDVGQFPVLRMNNLTQTGEIDLTSLKFMELDAKEFSRYLVKAGDILFNRTNSAELVGKTAIYRHTAPMAYAGYLIRLRANDENDPEYIASFLNTAYSKRMLKGMCKSIIGMANINAKEIQAMKIAQPPLPLQREFGLRILAIERQREVYRQSLTQLDTLFASLQHRAFRGEL